MSHPSRVRGLKLGRIYRRDAAQWASHPSRVRGLKCQKAIVEKYKNIVAPFTGAWIEIHAGTDSASYACGSHPSRVRGLKSSKSGTS